MAFQVRKTMLFSYVHFDDHLECITWLAGFLFNWEKSRRGGGGGRGTRGVRKGISGEEEQ